MKKNTNKIINITSSLLSAVIFLFCIVAIVANLVVGTVSNGFTNESNLEENIIGNGDYNQDGGSINIPKLKFTTESNGGFGLTAVKEALQSLENEKKRALNFGGIVAKTTGTTKSQDSIIGITVLQSMYSYCSQDVSGDMYYEEGSKETTSTGYGVNMFSRSNIVKDNVNYQNAKSPILNGSIISGDFSGTSVQSTSKSNYYNMIFIEPNPFKFFTQESKLNLAQCVLTKNIFGYKLQLSVNVNEIPNYVAKYETTGGAIKGSTFFKSYMMTVNFNDMGIVSSYEDEYTFQLSKKVGVTAKADTYAKTTTLVTYKNASYVVPKI